MAPGREWRPKKREAGCGPQDWMLRPRYNRCTRRTNVKEDDNFLFFLFAGCFAFTFFLVFCSRVFFVLILKSTRAYAISASLRGARRKCWGKVGRRKKTTEKKRCWKYEQYRGDGGNCWKTRRATRTKHNNGGRCQSSIYLSRNVLPFICSCAWP